MDELGKAAVVTMTVNGKNVAQGQLPRTIHATIGIGEGFDVGEEVGSPVDFTDKPLFRFTAMIDKVTIEDVGIRVPPKLGDWKTNEIGPRSNIQPARFFAKKNTERFMVVHVAQAYKTVPPS